MVSFKRLHGPAKRTMETITNKTGGGSWLARGRLRVQKCFKVLDWLVYHEIGGRNSWPPEEEVEFERKNANAVAIEPPDWISPTRHGDGTHLQS